MAQPTPKYELHHRLYVILLLVILVGFHLSALFYGERFRFLLHPYSGLGATETENGMPNPTAPVLFDSALICVAISLLLISIASAGDRNLPARGVRTVFSATAGLGALIATYPCDLYPVHHALGSGFLVGSLWILAIFFLSEVRKLVSETRALALHGILHITVVGYAITYVADAGSKQIFQKLAVFGLCGVLFLGTRLLARQAVIRADDRREISSDLL